MNVLNNQRIKTLRKKKGLTMEQAARAAGLKTRQAWARIEAGGQPNLGIQLLARVAGVLGVKAKDLLK
jgi:transcriptional regulator with XRE-family HTH domain